MAPALPHHPKAMIIPTHAGDSILIRVLFVCTGNICRSPTGEGVFRRMVVDAGLDGEIAVDSCGMEGWHRGNPPDRRAQEHAAKRGYDLSDLRARRLAREDFESFQRIIAMDAGHLSKLRGLQSAISEADIRLMMDYAGQTGTDVPDPYYDGPEAFDLALDLIEEGCRGLLEEIRADLGR